MPKLDLDDAYSIETPEDNKRYYAKFAETYDSGFAADMDFRLPVLVADRFVAAGGAGPVLDFGCGTGLVGEALAANGTGPVDGLDLSPEMLDRARDKGVYRSLMEGDILDGLVLAEGQYDGVTSSGTFTHGHVGPEALDALLRLARPGAVFALSINAEHFASRGFSQKLAALDGQIAGLQTPEVAIYGDRSTGAHKDDMGIIAVFRKR